MWSAVYRALVSAETLVPSQARTAPWTSPIYTNTSKSSSVPVPRPHSPLVNRRFLTCATTSDLTAKNRVNEVTSRRMRAIRCTVVNGW